MGALALSAFLDLAQIILIDLSLAADNALVVGAAVASLPRGQRHRALMAGIGVATVLRILMAFFAVQLLHITGLMLAGGILLAWVAWKMAREFHHAHRRHQNSEHSAPPHRTMAAVRQIIVADVSMSLDNVLGVAGVARDHTAALVVGLALSVLLMGAASTAIARLSERFPKVMLVGVAIVLYTALRMIYDGAHQIGLFA
ncbi:MAG: YjbE family putative metal transport protein [Alphaproteobacteria bacterium]|nr:YjbE family putative metal transport protein [Alphaproteobacteria bacterium]